MQPSDYQKKAKSRNQVMYFRIFMQKPINESACIFIYKIPTSEQLYTSIRTVKNKKRNHKEKNVRIHEAPSKE